MWTYLQTKKESLVFEYKQILNEEMEFRMLIARLQKKLEDHHGGLM